MSPATRNIPLLLLVTAAAFLAACGGGGTSPLESAPVGKATLDGQVLEVDGETLALDGLALRLVEVDRTAVTGADGTFSFGEVPTGTLTLEVVPSTTGTFLVLAGSPDTASNGSGDNGQAGHDGSGHDGSGHDEDEIEDGEHAGDQEMYVHRVQNREQVRVRVRVKDGGICEMTVSRESHREREVEIAMIRAATSDDPDIEGDLELESRDDRERFKVRVESATEGRDLEVYVIDPDGIEETQGTRTVGVDGEARWTIDTSAGGRLPFAMASVEDLEGYEVEVRDFDDGTLLLTATAPELPPFVEDDDATPGPSPDPDADPAQTRERSRARLQAHEPGLEGHVEVRSRPEDSRERLTIEAEGLATQQRVRFEVESEAGSGLFHTLRTRAADDDGEAELELDSADGDVLPNGALRVRELVRLRVRVCDDATGDTLLEGTIPELIPES